MDRLIREIRFSKGSMFAFMGDLSKTKNAFQEISLKSIG